MADLRLVVSKQILRAVVVEAEEVVVLHQLAVVKMPVKVDIVSVRRIAEAAVVMDLNVVKNIQYE